MKKLLITALMTLTCLISAKMYVPEGATAEEMQRAIDTERRLQSGGTATTATRTATPVYKNTGIVAPNVNYQPSSTYTRNTMLQVGE